jgi:hypothetical protein
MPTWLMSILSALAFGALVLGIYYIIGSSKKGSATSADSSTAGESAAQAGAAANNPLLKQVEVVGLRLTQNKAKKTEVRFLLVNHSGGEIPDASGTVTLLARTRKDGEQPVGSFSFKAQALGAYESKEMSELVKTNLKVYELPDWQNLDKKVDFTQP